MPSAIQATPEQAREFALQDYHGLGGARQARLQRYGRYGSPWGQVPPALEDHLRRLTGMNAAHMRMEAGLQELPEGKDRRPSPYWSFDQGPDLQRAKDVQLVHDGTGYIWTGWEDDPEFIAYKEGLGHKRQLVAQQAIKDRPESWTRSLFQEDNEMSQIARLFGELGDSTPQARRGSTPAAGGTSSQWAATAATPGYLGQQSAAQSIPGEE